MKSRSLVLCCIENWPTHDQTSGSWEPPFSSQERAGLHLFWGLFRRVLFERSLHETLYFTAFLALKYVRLQKTSEFTMFYGGMVIIGPFFVEPWGWGRKKNAPETGNPDRTPFPTHPGTKYAVRGKPLTPIWSPPPAPTKACVWSAGCNP